MNDWESLAENTRLEVVNVNGAVFRQGDKVRLLPRSGGDILDLVLAGRQATIEAIEQDFENRVYLAVTIDDDPGREWGKERQIGHRFFFTPVEVELIRDE